MFDRGSAERAARYDGGDCGSFAAPRRVTGADGGGTTGPMSPSGASSRSTITGAWSLGPLPLRAWRSIQAASTRGAIARAGEDQVDPHAQVLVEHARAVVPVAEHALAGPAVADDVAQPERLQVGQRLALRPGDVRVALVGRGVEHVGVRRGDVHVAEQDGALRLGRDVLAQRRQPLELVRVVVRARRAPVRDVDAHDAHVAARGRDRARLRLREAGAAGDPADHVARGRRARGSRPRSRPPRRGRRPRSRAPPDRRRAAP